MDTNIAVLHIRLMHYTELRMICKGYVGGCWTLRFRGGRARENWWILSMPIMYSNRIFCRGNTAWITRIFIRRWWWHIYLIEYKWSKCWNWKCRGYRSNEFKRRVMVHVTKRRDIDLFFYMYTQMTQRAGQSAVCSACVVRAIAFRDAGGRKKNVEPTRSTTLRWHRWIFEDAFPPWFYLVSFRLEKLWLLGKSRSLYKKQHHIPLKEKEDEDEGASYIDMHRVR